MAYCTVQQARDAGATGTDPEVQAAIDRARVLIDRYTGGTWWEPTAATLAGQVGSKGFVPLPQQVVTVTQVVRDDVAGSVIDPAAYIVRSSTTPGDPDGVQLRNAGADPLIAGAEPWVGGWEGFSSRLAGHRVEVTGTFGRGTGGVDPVIVDAAAELAAWVRGGGNLASADVASVDVEGNSLTITTTEEDPPLRTTGVAAVDRALDTLVGHRRVFIS